MPTVRFRIAHVSDLHLAEFSGDRGIHQMSRVEQLIFGYIPAYFRRNYRPWMRSYCLRHLRALTRTLHGESYYNTKAYDGYIFSGDLATTGLVDDMAAAAAYLHGRPMQQVSNLDNFLKLPSAQTVLIPGNHDRYGGNLLRPVSTEFERDARFGEDWRINPTRGSTERSVVNFKVFEKDGAELGVVCGDFSYTSENSPRLFPWYLGGGRVEESTLGEMKKATRNLREQGIPSIWVTHHAPLPVGLNYFLRLENARKLGDAALEAGVRIILCGHTHSATKIRYAMVTQRKTDRVRVICAGSATSFQDGARSYYDLEFSVASGVSEPSVLLADSKLMTCKKLGLRESEQLGRDIEFKPSVTRAPNF